MLQSSSSCFLILLWRPPLVVRKALSESLSVLEEHREGVWPFLAWSDKGAWEPAWWWGRNPSEIPKVWARGSGLTVRAVVSEPLLTRSSKSTPKPQSSGSVLSRGGHITGCIWLSPSFQQVFWTPAVGRKDGQPSTFIDLMPL